MGVYCSWFGRWSQMWAVKWATAPTPTSNAKQSRCLKKKCKWSSESDCLRLKFTTLDQLHEMLYAVSAGPSSDRLSATKLPLHLRARHVYPWFVSTAVQFIVLNFFGSLELTNQSKKTPSVRLLSRHNVCHTVCALWVGVCVHGEWLRRLGQSHVILVTLVTSFKSNNWNKAKVIKWGERWFF